MESLLSSKTQSALSSPTTTMKLSCNRARRVRSLHGSPLAQLFNISIIAVPCTFAKLQPREGMWQSTRLIEIDIGVLKYGRMQLNDLPKFDGVILCYDSLVPASYEALPNLMGGSSRLTSSPETFIPRCGCCCCCCGVLMALPFLSFSFFQLGFIGLPPRSLSSAVVPTCPSKYPRKS